MTTDYTEPLLAAQRALRRVSELAAERRYVEAIAHLTSARINATAAEKAIRAVEEESERIERG